MIKLFSIFLFFQILSLPLFAAGKLIDGPCFQGNGPLCLSTPSGCGGEELGEFCMACDVVRSLSHEGKLKSCSKKQGYALIKELFASQFYNCEETCHCNKNGNLLGCTEPSKDISAKSVYIYKDVPFVAKDEKAPSTPIKKIMDIVPHTGKVNAPNSTFVDGDHPSPTIDSTPLTGYDQPNNSQDLLEPAQRNQITTEIQIKVDGLVSEINEISQQIEKKTEQQASQQEINKLHMNMHSLALKIEFYNQQLPILSLPKQDREREIAKLKNVMLEQEKAIRRSNVGG